MSFNKNNLNQSNQHLSNSFIEFQKNKQFEYINKRNKKIKLLRFKKNIHFNATFNSSSKGKTFYSQSNTINTNYTYNNKDFNKTVSRFSYIPNDFSLIKIKLPSISIDEKVLKVTKKAKAISQKKKEETLQKLFNKEKNIEKVKQNLHQTRLKILAKNNKTDDMKRLKLKIHTLLTKETTHLCNEFELKNSLFNNKLFDFLSGKHNLEQSLFYHSKFRFNEIENEEAHDRTKMLIDVDSMRRKEDNSIHLLTHNLNNYEKQLIKEDPRYFFQSNLKSFEFKPLTLTQRLEKEALGISNMKRDEDFNFENVNIIKGDNNNKRNLKQKVTNRVKTDIEEKLNEINHNLNKTVYLNRTKLLKMERIKKINEHDKIMNEMNEDLRNNCLKLSNDGKKIDFKKRVYSFKESQNLYKDNILKEEPNQSPAFGYNLNLKNFKPKDIEFINRCKDQIKKNFDEISFKEKYM